MNADGRRYWRFNYRFAGKQKTLAVGVYPDVGLADSREKRDAARKLIAAGKDPGRPSPDRRSERRRFGRAKPSARSAVNGWNGWRSRAVRNCTCNAALCTIEPFEHVLAIRSGKLVLDAHTNQPARRFELLQRWKIVAFPTWNRFPNIMIVPTGRDSVRVLRGKFFWGPRWAKA